MPDIQTQLLISKLASDTSRVARLPVPQWRMLSWFFASLLSAALVIAFMGVRPDIVKKLFDAQFILEVTGAVITSLLAAMAAFCAGCPGRPVWERFVALPALAIWLLVMAFGCWQSWLDEGLIALDLEPALTCSSNILLVSIVPGILIFAMIRKGAPIAPASTAALAVLAATSLGAAAYRLYYPHETSLTMLTWQFGTVAVLTIIGGLAGKYLLRWPRPVRQD